MEDRGSTFESDNYREKTHIVGSKITACLVFCIKEILGGGGGGGFGLLLPLPNGLIPCLSWGDHALASKLTCESVSSIEFVPPFRFSYNFSFPLTWEDFGSLILLHP